MSNISKDTAIWMANITEALEETNNPLQHVYFTTVRLSLNFKCLLVLE